MNCNEVYVHKIVLNGEQICLSYKRVMLTRVRPAKLYVKSNNCEYLDEIFTVPSNICLGSG